MSCGEWDNVNRQQRLGIKRHCDQPYGLPWSESTLTKTND